MVHKIIADKATEIKLSLQTSDPSLVKTRQAVIAAYLESMWQSLRKGPTKLTHKQVVALSGEIYHLWVNSLEDNPVNPDFWSRIINTNESAINAGKNSLAINPDAYEMKRLEDRFGGFSDGLLANHGLVVDDHSRANLLRQVAKAMTEAAYKIKKFAEGDYSPDQSGNRFPKWEASKEQTTTKQTGVSLKGLLDGWWKEAQTAGTTESTRDTYSRTIKYFCTFIKHDDASKITTEDIIAYKDHRLHEANPKTGKTAAPKTVKDGDLAALKSILGWGMNNKKITSNPAQGVTLKIGKRVRTRLNYFSIDERNAILQLAKNYKPSGREGQKQTAAKRWIPWMCAYSGARVGEIIQLRKQDIREEEGHWIYIITPEAGTQKTKEARIVPIHSHLIDEGFINFVAASDEGYIFLNAKTGDNIKGKLNAMKNRLSEFIRTVVPDPNIAPNHGWRHTFKTLAREVEGNDPKVLDDIVGHGHGNEGAKYGASTIKAMAIVMKNFPKII
jgi:integrase